MSYEMHIEKGDNDPLLDNFCVNIYGMVNLQNLMDQCGMVVKGMDWDEARDKPLDYHGDKPGIEDFKFCSNDGWLVTPRECSEALKLYNLSTAKLEFAEEHQERRWFLWIAFIRRASHHGGFRVH